MAARVPDRELAAEERLAGGRAEHDERLRLHDRELVVEPRAAGVDLELLRRRVDPPLAALLKLEVLHDVRHVRGAAVDPGLLERAVELPAGGAHERLPGAILAVARLLAHQHHARARRPLAEHGLRGAPPEVTAPAAGGRLAQRLERTPL